jgi:phage terminase large subunit GpA-like protein
MFTADEWSLYTRSGAEKTEVMCPKCGKRRMLQMSPFWSGRGMPRIYCDSCRWVIARCELPGDDDVYEPGQTVRLYARTSKQEAPAGQRGRPWSRWLHD